MSTLKIKDADGNDVYLEMQSGDGSSGDPYIPKQQVDVGNFPATQPVSGTVGVNNFPASQTVDGSVDVSNFPSDQTVTPSTANITMDGESVTTDNNQYTGKRWVRVTNTHGSATVNVTIGSLVKTLAAGDVYETPLLGRGESLPTVEVDAASASADVEYLNA